MKEIWGGVDALARFQQTFRPNQSVIESCADVIDLQHVEEAGFAQHLQRLLVDASQDDLAAPVLHPLDHTFQRVHTSGIHRRDEVQPQDQHFRMLPDACQGVFHLFSRTKHEGTVDAIDQHAFGNMLTLRNMLNF